jgi:hypothetical protein
MQSEKVNAVDSTNVTVAQGASQLETVSATGSYTVECFDADGNLKWSEQIKNLVVTVGKNDLLDKYFTGTSYTAAWYLGLINSGGTYAAGDTMALHGGWTENTGYSNATRPAPSWGSASAGSKATTATGFSINASGTIGGAFLTTSNTKGGTTGILYSAGNFTGGNRTVASGDTLNVTYTASV